MIDSRLCIFARAPELGAVKTRIAREVGATRALEVYRALAAKTVALAERAELDVELWVSAQSWTLRTRTEVRDWARACGAAVKVQRGKDLGARMSACLRSVTQAGRSAIIIGTDCPSLDPSYLRAATVALENHDVVIGPAEDGGYVLIGASQ